MTDAGDGGLAFDAFTATAVPEPASLGTATIVVIGALARRRRPVHV